MGIANFRLARVREADENLAEAERLCAGTCRAAGELARARGVIEVDRNHLSEAEQLFRQSLDIARQQHDPYLEVSDLLNLGVTAVQQGHFDESLYWSGEARRIATELGAGLTEEKALGNLGWAYYKLGDFEQSESLFLEAEHRAREIGAVRDRTEWLNTLGLVYYQSGDLSKAEENYRQSLALAQELKDPIQISGAMSTVAYVLVLKGQTDAANQYCDQALALSRASGDKPGEMLALLTKGRAAMASGNSAEAKTLLKQVARESQGDISLRWEAENSLARLYEQQGHFTAADKQYRQAVATVEAARASLKSDDLKLPFLANASHIYDDYITFLIDQGKPEQALQLADYSRAQTLAEGLGFNKKEPLALSNPQRTARKMQSAILFYWLGQQHSYLWAVTPSQTRLIPLPPAPEIAALAQNYRKALTASRDVLQNANPDGIRLYELLVSPVADLVGKDSKVVILPDGALTNLNFETLLVRQPALHYWIQDVTVSNASSLRLLAAATSAKANRKGKLLLLGDAISPGSDYPPLPKARQEMDEVAKHFPPAQREVLEGGEATPSAYLASDPGQYAYIHFVAHGTASLLSPLDSAVVLSRASAQEDSFKLYARDILHDPLHADLVTISACHGAGSRAYAGEGLVGLSWAFLRAGAHNVIGALWEVSDMSTPQLMDRMYTELSQGESPDEALRAAKLAMMHSDSIFRKPFYWAPFQLYTGS